MRNFDFNLQWHLTERCNRRCKHCYQTGDIVAELTFDQLCQVHREYVRFLGVTFGMQAVGRLTLTGGEPFIREDFVAFLEYLSKFQKTTPFCILTNGSLLTPKLLTALRKLRPLFIQVSLDGLRETHDDIRKPGDFDGVQEIVRQIEAAKIPAQVSFTATTQNFRQFPAVAEIAKKAGASAIWTDRYIPISAEDESLCLSPDETREYLGLVAQSQLQIGSGCADGIWPFHRRPQFAVHNLRALQFLHSGQSIYSCKAGTRLLTILSDGTVVPCRRMPRPLGKVLQQPLEHFLTTEQAIPAGCTDCDFASQCRGGLRCLAYAVHHDLEHPDPGCWLSAQAREQY